MKTPLAIKGVREGLLITVPDGDWSEVLSTLLQTIGGQADFFRGARLALQLENRELSAAELGSLRDSLAEHEVTFWAVLSTSDATCAAAADLGLALEIAPPGDHELDEDSTIETRLQGEEAILVQRTLRSGLSIRHPGHVVVVGDVNPGAEIIAGGHVIVWGRLRGTVHAGAGGDESATVCALDLAPTQLRIAGQIAVSPSKQDRAKPEVAFLREGQLVAEPWEQ
ncbi:MAG: septum site-determining protein MinC [Anaerolineales bacterium]|nr:septum site-determining protein MinC [Anaerolineales bacterium]